MAGNAFTAGVKPGGLTTSTEIRILLCYLIQHAGTPLSQGELETALLGEELVNYFLSGFESDPKKIWESHICGKSLHELVNEGLQTKLSKMPEDAQIKLQETLERIVNEGSGGLICIIL